MVQHNNYRQSARSDRALDFHGVSDFVEYAREEGADVRIDPNTGRATIITEVGYAKLPGDTNYSYTQLRAALVKFTIIGIGIGLIIAAIVVPLSTL